MELNLSVIENTPGILKTNIDKLTEFVDCRLKDYAPENYQSADDAKKDRAELNNAKKTISQARISLMAELMKPYADFEKSCKGLEKKIEQASSLLDEIVKTKENEEKNAKREKIFEIWKNKNFNLFEFQKIFSLKWLNKTTKISEIEKEIDDVIARTYSDIKAIETSAGEDSEITKAHYLESLNLSEALAWLDNFKATRERVEKEKAEREEREHAEKIDEQKKELADDVKDFQKKNSMSNLIADALEVEIKPEKKEFIISFCGTESQFLAVKNFMIMQEIEIERAEEVKF